MKRALTWVAAVVAAAAVPIQAETIQPVKAAVFRSTGTQFLGQTIWRELDAGWSAFGDVPVQIDYTSLAGLNITEAKLEATGADVLVISTAGYMQYTDAEINAITSYVEGGHGIIITYYSFSGNNRRLAPLVGLSDTIVMGTGTAIDPIQFELLDSTHPLFAGLTEEYISGVRYRARPLSGVWPLDGGLVLANQFTSGFAPEPGIIANETDDCRGLYFSNYLEALDGGSNLQDMQVFYNGLIWAAAPEPTTAILLLNAGFLVCARRKL